MFDLFKNFFENYLSPLDKNSCVYFYVISVFFLVLLVVSLFTNTVFLLRNLFIIKKTKVLTFEVISGALIMLFNIFLAYFVNRLLYSICIKSL
jgi:hypothetical protein